VKETEIAWCNSTFNPWWGCAKVSDGCKNCYAETFAKRVGLKVWGTGVEHRRFGDKHWAEPLKWNAAAAKSGQPWRVFCASMADVFEGRDEDQADRERLFRLIEATPALTWLLLTKRPEHMIDYAPLRWTNQGWPRNVWAGCTVEDQENAERRIPHLLRVPAAVRFLSMEPLLGPVDLAYTCFNGADSFGTMPGIGWVIVGGESGHGARPFDLAWARSIREQCAAAGVPYFFKQAGAYPVLNDDRLYLKDKKGGDLDELWKHAPSVCVREWPEVSHA
jgi:protein gp37